MSNDYSKSNIDIEQTFATIQAMKSQEESGYRAESILTTAAAAAAAASMSPDSSSSPSSSSINVNDCRYKMVDWCYKVSDFCKFDRETVVIAASYLDRFLMRRHVHDRKMFQLLAMTCLYTAVKIHEPEAMPPSLLASLSKGCYTTGDIVRMERQLLQTIEWKLNPPTPQSFVRTFIDLLEIPDQQKQHIVQITKCQIDFSVMEPAFVTTPAITIAYAAIANALHATSPEMDTLVALCQALNTDMDSIVQAQDKLYWGVQSTMQGHEILNIMSKVASTQGDHDNIENSNNDNTTTIQQKSMKDGAVTAPYFQHSPRTTITGV